MTVPIALSVGLAFVFVLGSMIFVHELGHFVMARRIGVRVLTFSLGFGPKLVKFHWHGTDYCLSALPLGGYVTLAGEKASGVRTGAPDEFMSKTKWQRCQVLLMGPLMNVLFALSVMAAVLSYPAQRPVFERQPVDIGTVRAGSAGAKFDVRPGDRLVSVDDSPVSTWQDYAAVIAAKAKRTVRLGLLRDGRLRELIVESDARGEYGLGYLGIEPTVHPQVTSIEDDRPALAGGLQVGDVILAAGGADGITYEGLLAAIAARAGQRLELTVARAGQRWQVTLVPRGRDGNASIGATFSFCETYRQTPGAIEAIRLSAATNLEWGRLILSMLGGLFTGDTSVRQLMGPVAIAGLSHEAAQAGWIPLFTLLAMLSLNLGLMNLLPIPVLDGGHITMLAGEGLARREMSPRLKHQIGRLGALALLSVMAIVLFNDVMRLPWIGRLLQLTS